MPYIALTKLTIYGQVIKPGESFPVEQLMPRKIVQLLTRNKIKEVVEVKRPRGRPRKHPRPLEAVSHGV